MKGFFAIGTENHKWITQVWCTTVSPPPGLRTSSQISYKCRRGFARQHSRGKRWRLWCCFSIWIAIYCGAICYCQEQSLKSCFPWVFSARNQLGQRLSPKGHLWVVWLVLGCRASVSPNDFAWFAPAITPLDSWFAFQSRSERAVRQAACENWWFGFFSKRRTDKRWPCWWP